MITAVLEKKYTVEEYFDLEKNSDIRHEFYFGKLLEMPGESKKANDIANNILESWRKPLKKKGYNLYSHDVKAEVKSNGIYRYPDLVVTPESDDNDDYIVTSPAILVEVASENSWKRDTSTKLKEYTNLPSLRYYMIVSQEEMFVQLCVRINQEWTFTFYEMPEETVLLPHYDLKITVAEIYEFIKFGEA